MSGRLTISIDEMDQLEKAGIAKTATPSPPPPPAPPKAEEQGWGDWLQNKADRVGLATGLIDPATYRGRNPDGSPITAEQAKAAPVVAKAPAPRSWVDRVADANADGRKAGADGLFYNIGQYFDSTIPAFNGSGQSYDGLALKAEQQKAAYDEGQGQTALRESADPAWQQNGGLLSNVARWAATPLGGALADSSPIDFLGPGKTFLGRVAFQGGLGAATDAAAQGLQVNTGLRDEYDPLQTLEAAAGGAILQGAGEGLGKGLLKTRDWWKKRGVDTSAIPDDQLEAFTLDETGVRATEIEQTLKSAGAMPEQFSSPDVAARMADRVASARASQPANGSTAVRAVPDGVPIIGAPEGNVRGDDAGSIVSMMRQRVADSDVLNRAQERAADNPTLKSILDSNANSQQMIRSIWQRLGEVDEAGKRKPFLPPELPDIEVPTGATTLPRATPTGRGSAKGDFDAMIVAEGGTNRDGSFRTSPAGAIGPAQVMPGTAPEAARLAGLKWDVKRYRSDPDYNTALGAAYHKEMLRIFDGDRRKASAAYNAGPGGVQNAVSKARKRGGSWESYLPAETKGYLAKVFDGRGDGGQTPMSVSGETTYRAMDAGEVRRRRDDAGDFVNDDDGYRGFENTDAPQSPANRERFEGTDYTAPTQTGDSTKAFPATKDDPQGKSGFWEAEASRMQEEFTARQRQFDEEAAASGGERFRGDADDVKTSYKGKYDQRPAKDADFWRTTDDGYVAGKSGNPVAFRSQRDAAKWAAQNEMGGDFEMRSYGPSAKNGSQRVVLQRRNNSTYGQNPAPDAATASQGPQTPADAARFTRTDFERSQPPAGRTDDPSQRQIEGSAEQPAIAPQETPQAQSATPPSPEATTAPYRGPEGPAPGGSDVSLREEVVTADGLKLDTDFEVVEARDLVTSDNPSFDQRFQPRDRGGRAASDAQIADIASRLDPEQLGSSRLASQGAPIVGRDGMVESGNGRTAAIRRAYAQLPERAAEYRKMIERRGFDTSAMKEPVLIRRRATEMNDEQRAAFTRSAQGGGTMDMAPTEKAKADAKATPKEVTAQYRGGDVNSAANRDFVRSFMDKVVSPNERNALQSPDGSLSNTGVQRVRSAMLAKAFDEPALIEKITSNPDTEIKALGTVLTDLAPSFAQLKDRISAGDLPEAFDITPQIAEISQMIARSRAESKPISDFLDQTDIFNGDIDPITEALAGIMLKGEGLTKARSAKDVSEGLGFYLGDVEAAGKDLFGGDLRDRALEIVQAARERLVARDASRGETTGNLFGPRPALPGKSPATRDLIRRLPDELRAVTGERAELAAKLADIVGEDSTATYGTRALLDKRNRGEAEPETGRVFSASRGDQETLLHEAIHIAAVARYGYEFDRLQPGDLAASPAREILSLFNDARARAGRGLTAGRYVRYALSSPDEFLAMSLTNKSVQRWLDRGSLWDRFTDGVRKLLGLDPKFSPMLADSLRAGNQVLDAARTDPIRLRETGGRLANPGKGGLFDLVDADGLKRDAAAVKKAFGNPLDTAKAVYRPMRDFVSAAAFSNDARLRSLGKEFDSDGIVEVADHFHSRAGTDDGTTRTYHEAVARRSAVQMQQVFEAMEPFAQSPAALSRIKALLATPDKPTRATKAEVDAARSVRELLKDELAYRKDAGEDIGEVLDGYFPRVMDIEKVVKNRDKWLQQAEKLYRKEGVENPAKAAQAWFERVFDQYAGIDGGLDFMGGNKGDGSGLGNKTAKSREFGKSADELMSEFYSDDVIGTLAAYFSGSARRAEFTRRFGLDGREGSPKRAAWVEKHGDKTKLEVLEDKIKADLRNSDADAEGVLHVVNDAIASNLGRLGGNVSSRTRNGLAYLQAWNQLAKLDRTTVTSLTELAMGFVRGGPTRRGVAFVGQSLYEFGRNVAKADASDGKRWADALGIGQDAMVSQMLLSRAGIDHASTGTQKVMAGFYQGIGLHQFTEGTRTAAVSMGRKMIDVLAGDMVSSNARVSKRAVLYLKELGVSDPAAFAKSVRDGKAAIEDVRADKGGFASEYATALIRFTDQTIMMPNRAVKPTLASHPVGSLFYSLLSWSYGFKKNVLDRTARLAVRGLKDRDPALLAPAAGLVLLALWSDVVDSNLRPALFGSSYDFDKETPTEHALRVADRSGLTGALSPVINAVKGIKYQRSLAESVSGPAVGTVLASSEKVLNAVAGRNSPNTNTAERNAAGAIYEATLEPALDAFAAARLRGLARTAGILSTGNREGGVLPADRDWFVDTVAGEKKK